MKNYRLIFVVTFAVLLNSLGFAQTPQMFGFNEKDAQLITIKNTSADSADDFHLRVKVPLPGMGGTPIIKKVRFVPAAAGQTGAFRDSVFSTPYPSSCDWSGAGVNFKLGPGEAMRIQVWGNGVHKDSTYLTKSGVPISTNGLRVRMEINKGTGGSGTMKIVNEEGDGIILQNLFLHINNTNFPFDSVSYYPTGTVVSGIPTSMMINPGDSIEYPYNGNLAGNWITLHFIASKITSPGDYFEMGAAANDVINAIPTLPEWGLIIFTLLLLVTGARYISKRQLSLSLTNSDQTITKSQIDKALYLKVLGVCLLFASVFILLANWYFHGLSTIDTLGTLISTVIVSYMVYFLLPNRYKGM